MWNAIKRFVSFTVRSVALATLVAVAWIAGFVWANTDSRVLIPNCMPNNGYRLFQLNTMEDKQFVYQKSLSVRGKSVIVMECRTEKLKVVPLT